MGFRPLFEKLEDRILLTGEPTVTVDGPAQVDLGAQDVTYTLTFDNTSGDDTPVNPFDGDPGFAPFIDVILPTTGTDGDDGITFDSATFLGTTLTPTEIVFDASGTAEHPLAVDTNGDPVIITGTPGDTLLVFELPFGSFTSNQLPVEIELTLDFSPLADLDEPLTIEAIGGFALGCDPLDNPDTDPSIFGASDTVDVTAELITLTKTNDADETETATGPNYPRTWVIDVNVVDGQTVTDVIIQDLLPTNIHYLGNLTITGGSGTSTILDQPTIDAVVDPADNAIRIGFDTLDGSSPVQISFEYFIPETDFAGGNVLSPTTGDDSIAVNDVSGTAVWDPLDPRDDSETITADVTPEDDILELRSIAVQKSVEVTDDQNVAGPTPGDTLTFTLDLQISDFFTMGDIVLEDVLGDAVAFVPGSVNFSVVELDGTSIAAQAFAPAALTTLPNTPGSGQTTLQFNLSQAMVDAGGDEILVGDLIDGVREGATTAQITYQALIEDVFDDPADQPEVSQGDSLGNDVTVNASVRNNAFPGVTVGTEEDTSSAGVGIPFGAIEEKTVVAVNGGPPTADSLIAPGDEVTFSLIYSAPIGAFEDLVLDDFLPLPVFDATEVTSFTAGPFTGIPAAGTAGFGAATSPEFFANGGTAPVFSTNANSNSLSFDFGDFSIAPRQEIVIEIVFTSTVVDAFFENGLLLTNQASATEENTNNESQVTTEIAQFVYGEPQLEISKGVIAADFGTIDGPAGPSIFTDPGSPGPRAVGPINSALLDAIPVTANLEQVDAGDLVSFAIIVQSTGASPDGVFNLQIQDSLPDGFEIPLTGLNLGVHTGTGANLAFTDLGGGLFNGGIELVDSATQGALTAFNLLSGNNLVIVTYDLIVAESVGPGDIIINSASVENFSAFESGINRVAGPIQDAAAVATLDPTVEKRILDTSVGGDTDANVLIGETITFELVLDLTEGTTEDVSLIDRTRFANSANDPVGGALEILSAEVTAIGANLTLENPFAVGDGPTVVPFDSNGDGINDRVEFDFGDILNIADNVADADDQIVVQVTALVNATAATEGGDLLPNQALFRFEGETVTDEQNIRVLESNVSLDKTVAPTLAEAGDEVVFTVEVTNDQLLVDGQDRSASAFDLVITDLIDDPDLIFTAGSVVLSGAAAAGATVVSGNGGGDTTIEITLDELETDDDLIIEYRAVVSDFAMLGDILVNTADLSYDSLPDDDAPIERDYMLSDDAEVLLRAPELDKVIFSTSFTETSGNDLAIGEEVVFQITATIPEGSGDIIISDILPTANGTLTFLSAEVIEIGDDLLPTSDLPIGATAIPVGGVVTFDFGTLVNTPDGNTDEEQIIIELVGRIDDLPENTDGDTLTNTAQLQYSLDPSDTITATADVDIVEPDLVIDKLAPAGPVDAGDVIDYTLNVTNNGNAPAFDLVITDLLEDDFLELVPGSVAAPGFTVVVTEIDDGFTLGTARLDVGETLTITYSATVLEDVQINSDVTNTVTVDRFDTNPSTDPAEPGRVTTFDPANPDPDLTDTEVIPVQAIQLFKVTTVPATDDPLTGRDQFGLLAVDLGVGEEVVYTLTLRTPAGSANLDLTDSLPTGMQALAVELISLGGTTSAQLSEGDTNTTSPFITIGPSGQLVNMFFGRVDSPEITDGSGDRFREIVIEVTAQVVDVAAAVAGAELTNTAAIRIFNPADPSFEISDTATATIDVVEPSLVIDKIAPIAADQGDTVSYSVTVSHDASSSAPAYDLLITDALADPDLEFDSGSVVVVGVTGAVVTEVGTGFEISVPVLDLGQTITITYTATLSPTAPPAESFPNTAGVTYDSDQDPGGRVYTAEDTERVSTIPVVTKTLDRTSFAETAGSELGLGEVATYRFEIFLPEVLNEDVLVVDTLPTGLTAIAGGVRVLSVGANLTPDAGSTVPDLTVPDVTIAGQEVRISFGDIDVAFDDDINADDSIVFEVDAFVEADATVNLDGEVLENDVVLSLTAGGTDLDDDDSAEISVVVPELSLTKTASSTSDADAGDVIEYTVVIENTGSGPAYDLAIEDLMLDAGLSLVPASVVASDGSTATEIANPDATIGFTLASDVLDAGATLTITYQATVTDSARFNSSVENTARVASFDTNPLEPGDAGFQDEVTVAPDPTDPNDPLVDSVEVALQEVGLTKTAPVADTSIPQTGTGEFDAGVVDLNIGETVTYTLTIDVPEGSGLVVLTDSLPTGLEAISAEVTLIPATVSSANLAQGDTDASAFLTISAGGDTVTADFGLLTSTGLDDSAAEVTRQVEVQVTAIVTDIAANIAGLQLTNTATVQVFDPDAPGTELTDPTAPTTASETVEIVEPELQIEKTAPVAAIPGGTVTYGLVVTHTGQSTGPAFDLLISDFLTDPNLTFDSGSVMVAGVTGGVVTETGGGFELVIPVLELGETATITYSATLAADAPEAESFPNTANLGWDSAAGTGGRPDSAVDDALVATVPAIEKTLDRSSFAETLGSELGLGEVATFQFEIFLPEIDSENVVLTDILPDGLTPLEARVVEVGGQLAGQGTVIDLTMPDIDITGQTVTIDFDTVSNTPDGVLDDGDRLVIEIDAVLDAVLAVNPDGTVLTNTGTLTIDVVGETFAVADDTDVSSVVPELALTKTAAPLTGDAGDIISFTLEVENSGSGPAYDIAIEDLLTDAGLTLVSGSVVSSDGSVAVEQANGDGTIGFTLDAPVLDAGATLTVTYRATITNEAEFNGQVENTALVTGFDTNPGEPGDAGFEGEVSFAPNLADPADPLIDTAIVETPSVVVTKATSVSATDDPLTGDSQFGAFVDLGVGEEVVYTLTVPIPEGRGDIVLSDALPDGLQALSAEVISLGGTTSANLAAGDTDTSSGFITISGTGDAVEFRFGVVLSTGLEDSAGEISREIEVQVTAVVADVAAATAGVALTNTATVQVFDPDDPGVELTDPAAPITATETIDVVEPTLVIDKVAPVAAEQGDTLDYSVTVTHDASSSAPAYDLVIADALADPDLVFDSGSVVVTGVSGAVVTESATGFEVSVPTLELGATITINYTATLSPTAPPAQSFLNTAALTYDSDRDTGGRVYTADDTERVATSPEVTKTLDRTSYAETIGSELGLGEVATYRFEIVLPQVLNEDVLVVDTLPEGLAAIAGAVRVLAVGTSLTPDAGSTVPDLTAPDVTIAGQEVRISFGDINNAFDGVIDAGDRIIFEVDAVVEADATINLDGEVLENDATLSLTAAGTDLEDDDTADVSVVVPELSLTKTGSPTSDADAGDVIDFTIVIENSGTGPAYDLAIEDLMLDAGLSLVTGSVTASDGSTAVEAANTDGTIGFTLASDVLDAGAVLTITYQATITDAARFNTSVENTARVASFDTNPLEPGDAGFQDEVTVEPDPADPNDPLVGTVEVTLQDIGLEKTAPVGDTSEPLTETGQFDPGVVDLNIGETVTYTLTIDLPEGSGLVVLTDQLPSGLQAISAEVTSIPLEVTSVNLSEGDTDTSAFLNISAGGETVVADFGLVTSAGVDDVIEETREIEVQITAVVTDIAANIAGVQLTNNAMVQVFDPDNPGMELTDPTAPTAASETVEIVEPILGLDKSTTATGPVDQGDILDFTLVIENSGTSAAFDINIVDSLEDAGLSLVSGSVVSSDGSMATEVANADGTVGFTLIAPVLERAETLTITYQAIVTNGVVFNSTVSNEASVASYDSSRLEPGDPGFVTERTVTPDPTDPMDPLVDSTTTPTATPEFTKSIIETSVSQTGSGEYDPAAPDLAIGESVTYRFAVTLPEGSADLVIRDQFPLDAEFSVFGVDVTASSNFSGARLLSPGVSFEDSNGDGVNDLLTIFLGRVTNAPNNVENASDTFFVDIIARVEDDPRNSDGDSDTNTATLDFGNGTLSDTATVDVVEPQVELVKTVDDAVPFLGEVITYTLVLRNLDAATGPAFDLVIDDALPQGLTFTGAFRFSDSSLGDVTAGGTSGSDEVTITVPVLLPGQTLTIEYDVRVDFLSPVLTDLVNTATITGGSVPDGGEPPDFPAGSFPPGFGGDAAVRSFGFEDSVGISILPSSGAGRPSFSLGLSPIDDPDFLPFVRIDPIYAGSAEFGANMSLTLYDSQGGYVASREVLADAAGQWIASFPVLDTGIADRQFDEFFARGRLFDGPTGILPTGFESSVLGFGADDRHVRIGAFLADTIYRLQIEESASSTGSDEVFNTRLYYAPATNHEIYVFNDVLDVNDAFQDLAGLTVERLQNSALNPLASGVNRFNAEFLAGSATPGGS